MPFHSRSVTHLSPTAFPVTTIIIYGTPIPTESPTDTPIEGPTGTSIHFSYLSNACECNAFMYVTITLYPTVINICREPILHMRIMLWMLQRDHPHRYTFHRGLCVQLLRTSCSDHHHVRYFWCYFDIGTSRISISSNNM